MDIVLKDVSKYFGKTVAVKDFSLQFGSGEFTVILGPSGSGKSTVLNLIAGLEKPTQGDIYFGERKVTEVSPIDRNIAFVFQDYALYPHMSVSQNIAFPLKMKKVGKSNIKKEVDYASGLLNIEGLLSRYPSQLSGGQRQRVALARAIVRKPTAFLMDEPLSNLDAKLRVRMRLELKRLQKRLNVTTIYVTHDQLEAMTLGDKVAVIDNGQLQQAGTPSEIYNKPKNIFVADFVGMYAMNFCEAVVYVENDRPLLKLDSLVVSIPEIDKSLIGKRVNLAIRPEDIKVVSEGIKIDVQEIEYMGDTKIVYFSMGKELWRMKVDLDFGVNVGDSLYVRLNTDKINVYPKEGL